MNAHNPTLPPHAAAAHTILLVEDEALIALSEKFMLQKHGFTVLTAANGTQAVEMALGTPELDLILMDINLGAGLDGPEAAQQILAHRDVPIVFLSSHTEPDIVEKTEKITSYGYVVKNSGETVLIASIKMAVRLFDAHQQLKRQEAALREREAHIRNISNNLSSGMIYQVVRQHDGSRAFTYVSDVVQRFYGCTPQEVLADAKLIYNRVYPEDRLRVWQAEEEANRTLSPFKTEVRMIALTGGIRWSAFVSSPRKLADGSTCWDGIEFDITEHKQAENELRLHSIILQNIAEGVNLVRANDGIIVYTNPTFEQMFGYDPGELIGKHVSLINAPDDSRPEKIANEITAHVTQTGVWRGEVHNIKKDGARFWCQVNVSIFDHPQYGRVGVSVHQDITDRKRAEKALQESEERYRVLFEHAADSIAVIDPETYQILQFNRRTYEHLGYTAEEFGRLGMAQVETLTPEQNLAVVQQLRQNRTVQFETKHRAKTGELRDMLMNITMIRYQGKMAALGIGHDITDRKRTEDALRKSEQQLRELNAQKDKFFSILAHDLKNPLAGFLAFANLLELDFDRIAPAERNTFIQHFRASAEILVALLENLLTWGRLQNGQIESIPDIFPLDYVAARAVALLAPNAVHKQITLTNAMPAVAVYADISMTDTVMRNLLVNALKFTPAGGTVTISATYTATDVCVTVADTGIGIPPEKVAQLFRIDGKTQRDGTAGEKGTGLGLILCKEFVEKQGGRIWAESEPGNGARIRFTLPVKPG